ncbi:hypothetical protein [Actinoplanes sp. NPDC049118]|uniref:hypothetical protein n=1 Tax=Actinoplanes sp. NPDC049118 TaxID=3155769 RepID=UPI0033C15CFD
MTAGWVRRAPQDAHRCDPPQNSLGDPSGRRDDLWRCDCGDLWRIGRACAACEYYGYGNHGGQHRVGNAWRPATLSQRIGVRMRRWRR